MILRRWRHAVLVALVAVCTARLSHAAAWKFVRSSPIGLSSAVVEPLRHRLFVYGSWDAFGQYPDLWSVSLDSLAAWQRVSTIGVAPPRRSTALLFADPARGQILAFGDRSPGPTTPPPLSSSDVWSLDVSDRPTWELLDDGSGGPTYGSTGAAALDTRRGLLLAFGGEVARNTMFSTNGTWQIGASSPAAWAEVALPGAPPSRGQSAAAYDSVSDRFIVTGGERAGTWMAETWARSLPDGDWQLLPNSGTVPSVAHRGISWTRTAARTLCVLDGTTLYSLDLSRTDVAAWTSQTIPPAPGLQATGLAWDEATESVWTLDAQTCDLWRLRMDGAPEWELAMPAPVQLSWRVGASVAFDPTTDRTRVMFGYDLRTGQLLTAGAQASGDDLAHWSAFSVTPSARTDASVVLDDANRRLIVFGGLGPLQELGDLWEYGLETGTWAQINAAGESPAPRFHHSAVIDTAGHRMIVFGGAEQTLAGGYQPLADMWALSLDGAPAWTRLEDAPAPRMSHAAVWDVPRQRMVVTGGILTPGSSTNSGDIWEWAPDRTPAWQQDPVGYMSFYSSTAAVHDELHEKLLLLSATNPVYFPIGMFELDLPTLTWNGFPNDNALLGDNGLDLLPYYDALRRRAVLFQGATTWMLALDEPSDPQTSLVAADGVNGQAQVEWSVVGDAQPLRVRRSRVAAGRQVRTFEGLVPDAGGIVRVVDTDVALGDTLHYALEPDVEGAVRVFGVANVRVTDASPPPPPPGLGPALAPISPALSAHADVRCTLPDAAPTTLEVFDLTGRRVVETEIGNRGPGTFTVTLDHRFRAGMYFVQMRRAGTELRARLVVAP